MTDRLPAPTYRQRFTDAGKIGLVMMIAAPIIYGIVLALQEQARSAWDRPSDLWLGIPAILALIGPALLLVGREYYDATAEIEAAKSSPSSVDGGSEPLAKMKAGR